MDHEDLIQKILDGLDNEDKSITDVIEGHDTPISFDELHKNLINKELSLRLLQSSSSPLPASANVASNCSNSGMSRSLHQCSSWLANSSPTPSSSSISHNLRSDRSPTRPYLGKCQGRHL